MSEPSELPMFGTPGWDALEARRGDLIDKKIDHGIATLTPEEVAEYHRLQGHSQRELLRMFPSPFEPAEQRASG